MIMARAAERTGRNAFRYHDSRRCGPTPPPRQVCILRELHMLAPVGGDVMTTTGLIKRGVRNPSSGEGILTPFRYALPLIVSMRRAPTP